MGIAMKGNLAPHGRTTEDKRRPADDGQRMADDGRRIEESEDSRLHGIEYSRTFRLRSWAKVLAGQWFAVPWPLFSSGRFVTILAQAATLLECSMR